MIKNAYLGNGDHNASLLNIDLKGHTNAKSKRINSFSYTHLAMRMLIILKLC